MDRFNLHHSFISIHRKAVRATAILIPLLGLQFLLFIKRPEDKDSTLSTIYQYVLAIFVPLQVILNTV